MPRLVKTAEYESFIRDKPYAVILFDAPWNASGRPLRPRFDTAIREFVENVNFGEVNTDDEHQLATGLKLVNVPAVAFYRDGTLVVVHIGATQDVVAQTEVLIAREEVKYIVAKDAENSEQIVAPSFIQRIKTLFGRG